MKKSSPVRPFHFLYPISIFFAGRCIKSDGPERTYGTLQCYGLGLKPCCVTWKFEGLGSGDLKWQNDTSCYLLDVMRTKTSLSSNLTFQLSPQCSQHVRRLIETVEYTDTETFGHRFLFQPVNIHTNRYFPSTSSKLSRENP